VSVARNEGPRSGHVIKGILVWGVLVLAMILTAISAYRVLAPHRSTRKSTSEPRARSAPRRRTPVSSSLLAESPSWYMFRGGQSLEGVHPGCLPDDLGVLWRFKTDGPVSSSPAIADGRGFVGSDDGKVYAIGLERGDEIWSFQTGDSVSGSPLVLDGSVYVGSADGNFYCIDAATGDEKWRYQTGGQILASANWGPGGGSEHKWVIFGGYDNMLYCLDASEGSLVWKCEAESYINGTPGVADGKVVFGSCDAKVRILSIADGELLTEVDAGSYIPGSPAISEGYAYVANYGGELHRIEIATGRVAWTYRNEDAPIFSSPAVWGDRVVFGARDNRVYCISRQDGARLWTFNARGAVDSSPVICEGKVVFGSDDGRVYVLDLSDGSMVCSYNVAAGITSSPGVSGGVIAIGCDDGYVYAFGQSAAMGTRSSGK